MGLKTITATTLLLLSCSSLAANLHMGLQDTSGNNVLTQTTWTINRNNTTFTVSGSVLNIDLKPGNYRITAKTTDGRTGTRKIVMTTESEKGRLIVK